MFHGVTACPDQFDGLAKTFFDAGYNVYAPLTPQHGFADKKTHGKVTADELVDYVNQSVTIGTGLGSEVGVVGLSGGGMLATWASEYRPEVKRALALSPFYEPASAQAPKWQLPFLSVMYGYHILPDNFIVPADPNGAAFSYRALANYLLVKKNLKESPDNLPLKSFSVITSDDDDQIDLPMAHSIPQDISAKNPKMTFLETNLPAEWKIGHDIVSLENANVASRSEQLFRLYFNSYEGKTTNL
ncbi:alpha/beta fold hydrolase [Candidatus Saccharibacteria bacterium]|nr:alpha/beta fold hydrolase [Candidatus Saccharibacteria bacterium]